MEFFTQKENCMKKALTLMLLLVLSVSLVFATGAAETKTQTAKKESVVVSTMTFNNIPESYDKVNNAINEYIAKTYPDLNVEIDVRLFGLPDFFEKIPLAITSGDKMDVFLSVALSNDVAKGMMYPLNDLLDQYGQKTKDILAKDFGVGAFDCTTFNGEIYAVPINKAVSIPMMILYDEEYLTQLGYTRDDITCLDDIEKIMADCQKKLPNVIPFHPLNQGNSCIQLWMMQEYLIDTLGDGNFLGPFSGVTIGDSSKVVNLYESDAFRQSVEKMNSWYEKGYIRKDAATSQAIATEYFASGRCLFSLGGYSSEAASVAVTAMAGRNIGMKQINQYYMGTSAITVVMGIASTTKVPEASMKMLDLVYTDEFIINTILYGIEGEDYVKVGDKYWAYPEGKDANTVEYTAALCTGVIGSESLQYQPAGTDANSILVALKNNVTANRSPFFGFVFDSSAVTNEIAAVTAVNDQYIKGFECGSIDASAIAEFNKALYAAGLQKIIDAKQEQLDAWLKTR